MKRWGFLLTMSLREYCVVSREQRLRAQLETRNVPTIHSTKLQTEPVWIVQSGAFFLSFFLSFCFLSLTHYTYSLWYRGLMFHMITHMDTLGMTPLDEGPARHRAVYLTTHNTHKRKDIHAAPPHGIRTRNPSNLAVTDPRFWVRGHRDRARIIPGLEKAKLKATVHLILCITYGFVAVTQKDETPA